MPIMKSRMGLADKLSSIKLSIKGAVAQSLILAGTTILIIGGYWLLRKPAFLYVPDIDYTLLSPDYSGGVRNLLGGQGLTSFRYPPVFPAWLAGTLRLADVLHLRRTVTVALMLLGINTINTVLIFLNARLLWDSPFAFLAPSLWLAHPATWRQFEQPLSGSLFTMLLLSAILVVAVMLKRQTMGGMTAISVGVLLGLAMLTRPNGIALGLIVALFVLFQEWANLQSRLLFCALLLGAVIMAVLPWEIHAYQQLGKIIPLSTGGTPSILDGLSYAVDSSEARSVPVPEDVRQLQVDIYEQQYRELNSVGQIARYLWGELGIRPLTVFKLFLLKAARAWYGTDSGHYDGWMLIGQVPFLAVSVAGLWAALQQRGWHHCFALLGIVLIVYLWGVTILVLSILRYMIPALAILFIFAPGAAHRFIPLTTLQVKS